VGASSGSGPYVLTWNLPNNGTQYLQILNTGSLDLAGETFSAVNSKPTNGNAPPTVALDACVGATWTAAGSCAGTVTRLTTSSDTSSTVALPIKAGAAVSVKAAPLTLPNFPQTYTTTVTVTVTRAQARTATTITS
jgi:hypothetical protein